VAAISSGTPTSGTVIEATESEYAPVAVSTPALAPGASDGVPAVTTSFIPEFTAASAGLVAPPARSLGLIATGDVCGAKATATGRFESATEPMGEPEVAS